MGRRRHRLSHDFVDDQQQIERSQGGQRAGAIRMQQGGIVASDDHGLERAASRRFQHL